MRRYGRIQGLVLALGSAPFYRDVARNWRGVGFLYVLLLLTLTWIPVLIYWQVSFTHGVRTEMPKVLDKLPPITIKDGKASSPVAQPYTVTNTDTGEPFFILDTTGEVKSLEGSQAHMLLTETTFHIRDERKTQIHDLGHFPDMTLTKEQMQGWLETLATWLGVGLFPFVMIGSLVRALVLMLVAAMAGLILDAAFFGGRLGFAALLRLAAVGMSLSIYLDTGLMLAGVQVPFWFGIAILLTVGYVAFGAHAAAPVAVVPDRPPDDYLRPGESPMRWPPGA